MPCSRRRSTTSVVLFRFDILSRRKSCSSNLQAGNAPGHLSTSKNIKYLEPMPTDARGPQRPGQIIGVLSRRAAADLRLWRRHRAALGRDDGELPPDARGPWLGPLNDVLSRRAAAGLWLWLRHRATLG